MISRKRGRPKTNVPKLVVTTVKLTEDYKSKLESLAASCNVSVYEYVNRLIQNYVDEHTSRDFTLGDYDYEEPEYVEPEYWVDEDGMYHEGPEPEEEEERFSLGSLFTND